jgi:DNA-binding transcriptional LysR family regulator
VEAGFEPRIAFVTRDPVGNSQLVARGLAVTLVPELLVGRLPGVAMVPLEGLQPHRALYALTPAAGVRASALAFVAALDVKGHGEP